jgi:hypothetical protein
MDGLFCSIIKANAVNEAARNKVRVDNEILREVTEAKMSGIMIYMYNANPAYDFI